MPRSWVASCTCPPWSPPAAPRIVLHDGEVVTVDGTAGEVREGRALGGGGDGATSPAAATTAATAAAPPAVEAETTATLLYVNLAIAEHAEEVAALPVDGVGLLRAEFMITDALGGEHPHHMLATGRRDEFVARMSEQVLRITRAFMPRPVVYRAVDFRTNEFRGLTGGEDVEPVEAEPDDRLSGLLPLHPRPGAVRARPGDARPGPRRDRRTSTS